jgi:hypothetical protein
VLATATIAFVRLARDMALPLHTKCRDSLH